MTWVRTQPRTELAKLTTLWHLEDETPAATSVAGLTFGVCGSNLGAEVDRRDDVPDSGDRCPPCGGAFARGDA